MRQAEEVAGKPPTGGLTKCQALASCVLNAPPEVAHAMAAKFIEPDEGAGAKRASASATPSRHNAPASGSSSRRKGKARKRR